MLKAIGIIAAVLVLAIGAVLLYAATRPDTFRVQRSIVIKAPPEKIFALLNDFRAWSSWSPYEHRDPAMKRTLSGAQSGRGAIYEWEGNSQVGKGRMEITDETPPRRMLVKLDFLKPFEAHNTAEFTVEPQGGADGGSNVTWAMYGPNLFIGKVMSVFMSMDSMVGKDFEAGLANLKSAAEK